MTTVQNPRSPHSPRRPPGTALGQQAAYRRGLAVRAGLGVVAVGAAGALIVMAVTGGHGTRRAGAAAPVAVAASAAKASAGVPPWPAPVDAQARMAAAGLPALTSEGTAEHYHAHLDVVVEGKAVAVPADIGVDDQAQRISIVHTHDQSGVIHVESPTVGTSFYLGQLFTEWDVALTPSQIGGLHVDGTHTLTAFVDGKPYAGNPATIKLAQHEEITLVYGSAGGATTVPSSFDFAAVGL